MVVAEVDPAADLVVAGAEAEVEDQGLAAEEVEVEAADQGSEVVAAVAAGFGLMAPVEELKLLCSSHRNRKSLIRSVEQPRWPVSRLVGPAYVELRCESLIVSC